MLSKELLSLGWVAGFPDYTGSWVGYEVEYFNGIAWHRKIIS